MGGEPTFVSIDDLESPEWNIAAVGPTKRALADELIRRLRARFAPGGLLHYGQGKWYPGESLPRWAFGLYWRKDGVPIWKNADLIAKIESPRKADHRRRRALCWKAPRSGSASIRTMCMPAFEDPAHWLQKEAALPVNVDPGDSKLADPEERARMARVFDAGPQQAEGLRAADPALERRAIATRWMQRALAAAARQPVPDAGRFAARAAAADGVAAAYSAGRISLYRRAGSAGAAAPNLRPKTSDAVAAGAPAKRAQKHQIKAEAACARRSRSRSATACSAPSCRRSRSSKIISN